MFKKKIIAAICSVTMLVGAVPKLWIVSAASAEEDTYIYSTFDDLESTEYADGASLDQQSYVFTNTQGTASCTVVDEPGAGDKSVKLSVTKVLPEVEDPQMTPFLKIGTNVDGENVVFETKIKIDADFVGAANNASSFSFGPTKGGPMNGWWPTKDSLFVRFAGDGVYIPVNKTTNTKIGTYERNKWYSIKIFMQKSTGYYGVTVKGEDGQTMKGEGTISNMKDFFPVSEFRTRYDARNNHSCGSVYISYIKVSENRGYELLSSSPEDGAVNVDPENLQVHLNFSENINPDTLTEQNISVVSENGLGQKTVPVHISTDGGTGCRIAFPEGAQYGTKYTVKLGKGVTDLGGMGPKGADTISFTTKTQSLPSPELIVDSQGVRFYRTDAGMKDITQSGLEDGEIQVSSSVTNKSRQEQNITMYTALYETVQGEALETADRLIAVTKKQASFVSGSTQAMTADISVPEGNAENKKIVVYWCADAVSRYALCDPVELDHSGRTVREESIDGVPAVPDSEISLTETKFDEKTGLVAISGKTSAGMGRKIFLTAEDSKGSINSVIQTASRIDGSFAFQYYLGKDTADGVYTIHIDGVGAQQTVLKTLDIAVSQAKPVAFLPRIQGECTAEKMITASYDYFHAGGMSEGQTLIEWLWADTADGNYEKIADASGAQYEISPEYINQYIKFQVTPVTINGIRGETVFSEGQRVIPAPSAGTVRIQGKAQPGEILSGSYEYSHPMKLSEGNSEYRWLKANSSGGIYEPIEGADKIAYVVSEADIGAYIVLEVTPVSIDRDMSGNEIVIRGKNQRSTPVQVKRAASTGGETSGKGESITVFPGKEPTEFEDIQNHWAKYAIKQMAEKGIVQGISERQYAPDLPVTRAEFITMIVRALQAAEKAYQNIYEDVAGNDWYSGQIQAAYELGIIAHAAQFRPNDPMIREEMCKIIVSAYAQGKTLPEAQTAGYLDYEDISDWARAYVNQADEAGLVQGTEQNRFEPKRAITRAEAAVLIQRLLNLQEADALDESAAQQDAEADPEGEKQSYQNAALVLKALDILDGSGEEEENMAAFITKGAFVIMMMRAAGITDEYAGAEPISFQDIIEKDEEYPYISAAYSWGLIDGGETFGAQQYISLQNAVTMLIRLLGYDEIAPMQGGFMNFAYQKELTKGLNVHSNAPLSLGEAALLVFNTLGIEVMQLDSLGDEHITYSNGEGETMAERYLNVCVGEGRITANDVSSVEDAKKSAPQGRVIIDDEEMYVGDTQADDYLGYIVCYYAKLDPKTEEKTLQVVYLTKNKNTLIQIPAEDVTSFYNMTLSYYEKDGKKTNQRKIPRDASVIFNGVYMGYANDVPEGVFTGKTGSIDLLDSQGGQQYDTVIVTSYETYIVKYVDRTNQIIYDKYGKPPIFLTSNSAEVKYQVIKYGMVMDIANLKENDILLVADSGYYSTQTAADKRKVELLTSSKFIEGTAAGVRKDEVMIDETVYKVSPDFKNVGETNEIKGGDRGRFYLDSFDRVAYFDNGREAGGVRLTAFVIDAFMDEDQNLRFYLFNSQGEHLQIQAAKTLRIDGTSYKDDRYEQALALLQTKAIQPGNDDGYITTKSCVNQLIYYELNDDGQLSKIDTEYPAGTKDKSKLIKDVVINDKTLSGGLKYNAYVQTFSGDILLSNSTVIFGLPQDLSDKENYGIVSPSALVTDKWYKNLTVYNLTEYGMTDLVVMPLTTVSNVDGDTSIFVVDRMEQVVNDSQEVVTQVYGVFEGKEVSYLCENNNVSAQLEDVRQGDIIRIALNDKNEIKLLEKSMLFDPVRKHSSVSNNYTNQFCLFYGSMTIFDKTMQMAAVLEDGTGQQKYFNLSRARVVVVDREGNSVRAGSFDDIMEGMANAGGNLEVVVRNRYSESKDIVIYLPEHV